MSGSRVRERQAPLIRRYRDTPEDAVIEKRARTVATADPDPFHVSVRVDGPYQAPDWDLGIDHKVGGDHDLPNPAEMLLAALAGCHASTLRMVADNLGVDITSLEVVAHGQVDARGCLAMDDVTAGFDEIHLEVDLRVAEDTDPRRVERLHALAERLCVTAATLRRGVPISTTRTD